MKTVLHKADTRGSADHGWLKTKHSFSFASYYNPDRVNFGLLRVLNDDTIAGGMGFGMHPHDNMEIVTIPLYGDLKHQDSLGSSSIIRSGDVQIMSAGTGIRHSEFNPNHDKETNLLQIWVFPKTRNIKPRYNQKTFDVSERQNKFQTVVAPDDAKAIWINQDAWFSLGNFEKDKSQTYQLHKQNNGVYAFVIKGSVQIHNIDLSQRDALGIWDTTQFTVKATSDAEILLIEVPME